MRVVYVDTEHQRVHDHPEGGSRHRARLAETTDRLERVAGAPAQLLGFAEVSPVWIAQSSPAAIIIGGNTTDWGEFDFEEMAGLLEVIRAAPVPILGICAGHQLIGYAHHVKWGPLGPLQHGEIDPDSRFAPGQRKQRGFLSVQLDLRCPLFRGMDATADLFQSHYWQLEDVPPGFAARASSPWSAIQAIERLGRPVFGVQFHPERYDAAHPHGAVILRNFITLARDWDKGESNRLKHGQG
jgi:GMP synthase-like glutamine amidotransferase